MNKVLPKNFENIQNDIITYIQFLLENKKYNELIELCENFDDVMIEYLNLL